MAWNIPAAQTPGQPATAAWANIMEGNFSQIGTLMPLVSGGLTGATQSGRFVGFTSGNAPTTGAFVAGDFAFDRSGTGPRIWCCTSSGSPGAWAAIGAAVPVGTIVAYTSSVSDPAGWLLADGRAVSRTTYAALYSLLVAVSGTDPFGTGDGSTTFNIPDLRSRVVMGADNMGTGAASRTSSGNTMAAASGEDTHTLTLTELTNHNHSHAHGVSDPAHSHSQASGSNGGANNFANTQVTGGASWSTGSSGTGISINSDATTAGSSTAHNTRQLSLAMTWIIKT